MNQITVHAVSLLTAVGIFYGISYLKELSGSAKKKTLYLLFFCAFFLRCLLAWNAKGYAPDINCFYSWSKFAFEEGISTFYSSDMFADYPPGFVYIFYLMGAALSLFKADSSMGIGLLILKFPAILCDIASGILLYRMARKQFSEKQALLLSALYLFNPAVLVDSCIWGQTDSVFTLMVILMCLFLTEGKTVPAYIVYGAGILLKPQTAIFTPILLCGIWDHVISRNFSWRNFFFNLCSGLCVIFCMLLLCTPFGLDLVVAQYTDTLGSYPYAAVNAFNFWGLFGLNWTPQENRFLFLSYAGWGTLFLILIVAVTVFLFYRQRRNPSRYFLCAAFLMASVFLLSVRMHERYLFPTLLFLLSAYAYKPVGDLLYCYAGFSAVFLYNTCFVLYLYEPANYNRKAPVIVFASALMLLCAAFLYRTLLQYEQLAPYPALKLSGHMKKTEERSGRKKESGSRWAPASSAALPAFTTADWIIMLAITLIYAVFALYDLGDRHAPESYYCLSRGDTLTFSFDEDVACDRMYWYLGNEPNKQFALEVKAAEDGDWYTPEALPEFTMNSVFRWEYITLPEQTCAVRLTALSDTVILMELSFTDAAGQTVMPVNAPQYTLLFDESSLRPDFISFRNGTYFDEIYYARTAYEFLNGLTTYETTHPPFGKCLIALGVKLFGLNPFGWRIMGTLFGIFMLPFLYLLGRCITKNRVLSGFSCLLFAFDFMHFTQTRIATIDVFVTFFIIVMYYFMYRYCQTSFYDASLGRTLIPLGISGVAMGFGIAGKWTGVYAGAGLAVLFFGTLYRRYREYLYAKADPRGTTNGISHKEILNRFVPYTKKTILFCIGFFVVIPCCIYLLSYLPFRSGDRGLLARMLYNQQSMLQYHSSLNATHPYSSPWYQWPLMIRPIFYYSGIVSDTLRQGISAFGNPLVWWAGIPAFAYMVILTCKKKDRTAAILCVSYLAQYLPWVLVSRLTFIYHYFPSVPFVVLMLAYAAAQIRQHMSERRFHILVGLYAACAVGLFLLFYPVLSGQTVDASFVKQFLRWLDSWVLIG